MLNSFEPKDRQLYRYFDGGKMVGADPMALVDALAEHPDLENDSKLCGTKTPLSRPAFRRVVVAVRRAFNVGQYRDTPEGGEGLTDLECLDLLHHFSGYLAALSKKNGALPT